MSSRTPETIDQDFSAEARVVPPFLNLPRSVEFSTGPLPRRGFFKLAGAVALATAAACTTPRSVEIIPTSTPIPTIIVPTPDNPSPTPTPVPTVRPEASATPSRPGGVNDPEVIENALIQPWPTLGEFPQVISAGGPLIIPVESNIRSQYEAVKALIMGSNYDATHKFNPVNDQNAVKNPWDVYLAVYDNAQPGDKARWAVAGVTQEGFVLPVDSQGNFMDRPDYTIEDSNKAKVAGFALLEAPNIGRTDIHFGFENANDHWTPVVRALNGQILGSWNFNTKQWEVIEVAKPKEGFDPNRVLLMANNYNPQWVDLEKDELPESLRKWGFATVEDLKSTLWTKEQFAQQASDQLGIPNLQTSYLGTTPKIADELWSDVMVLRLLKKGVVDLELFGQKRQFEAILVQGITIDGFFVADWRLLGFISIDDFAETPCAEWNTDPRVAIAERISNLNAPYPPEPPLCSSADLAKLYADNPGDLMFVVSVSRHGIPTTIGVQANNYLLRSFENGFDPSAQPPQDKFKSFLAVRIALPSETFNQVVQSR